MFCNPWHSFRCLYHGQLNGLTPDIIAAVDIVLAQVFALWCMNASQTRRTEKLQHSTSQGFDQVSQRIDQLRRDTSQLSQSLQEVATELQTGQQALAESVAKLDSRVSHLEGWMRPKPWESREVTGMK